MRTKELFVRRMSLLQNYFSEQETLGVLIRKLTDGHPIVTIGDYLVAEYLTMISEAMGIEDDSLLSWWLWENVEKVIYVDGREISVRTLDELYDYIIKEDL